MQTKRIKIKLGNISDSGNSDYYREYRLALQEAALLLIKGEIVAFPTETVYGLGADALNEKACQKIFAVKGRPADNPLIVHVAEISEARRLVRDWPETAEICALKFWPGPLTLVLPKAPIIPDIISAGLDTVALRMPSHQVALDLISAAGCPLAAPSANISGKPSPTDGAHVWQDLEGKIPLILDAGNTAYGLESTVLDLTGEIPVILRPGGVTREQLSAELGRVEADLAGDRDGPGLARPKSPGMKYRHYAPSGEIILLEGELEEKADKIAQYLNNRKTGKKVALLCMQETFDILKAKIKQQPDLLYFFGSQKKPGEAASHLFAGLRLCDQQGIDIILAEGMPSEGIGLAFMNRLHKAAGKR